MTPKLMLQSALLMATNNTTTGGKTTVEKVVAVSAKLNRALHADLVITVRYTYDQRTCKSTNVRLHLEQEGWGLRGVQYRDEDKVVAIQGWMIRFEIDFSLITGPASISREGLDIPLPSVTRLFTLRGDVDTNTGKGFATTYPRGY